MGDSKLSRRQFLKKTTPNTSGVRIEHFPLEQPSVSTEDLFKTGAIDGLGGEITLQGGLDPYAGPWTRAEAAHLLRRTTFGLKQAHLDQMLALGSAEAAVDAVLTVPGGTPDPPINNYNNAAYTDPDVPAGQTWINAPINVAAEGYRKESWRGWWLNRMVEGGPNIQEKMTLFWHNHFATEAESLFWARPIYRHNQLLRTNALGNFKAFVRAVTIDPFMLYYLNGLLNDKSAPDQNYARELQELFTVGKDSPSTYTQDDVVAAARVLTGWRVNPLTGDTFFLPTAHDAGFKVFSTFYNNTVIQGSLNGNVELDALLNMIFQKQEVSLFICRKIYRFFVYYKIDAEVEANVIVPMAEIFRNNNYEILPVMRALLLSEHFYDAVNKGCMIKNPLDMVVGLLRNYNLSLPGPTLFDQYFIRLSINFFCGGMQMLPGDPPNVAGWQAYRQAPTYYRTWISSDTIRNRNVLTDVMSFLGVDVGTDKLIIDHVAFAAQFSEPSDPNKLVDDVVALLHPMPISDDKKLVMKSILLSGQQSDHYWTDAWYAYVNNPGDPMAYQTVWFRLASLHKHVMNLAEFQLA